MWALDSALKATPARTAVLMVRDDVSDKSGIWRPAALAGVVPEDIPPGVQSTPILDRFLYRSGSQESYLPTLQALPGRVEFEYLPPNAQEALLLPVTMNGGERNSRIVLVLGSDTAKSCTPRDIAWCQVLVSRMGTFFN